MLQEGYNLRSIVNTFKNMHFKNLVVVVDERMFI